MIKIGQDLVVRELHLSENREGWKSTRQRLLVELVGLEKQVVVVPVCLRPTSPPQGHVQQLLSVVERALEGPGEHHLVHLHLVQHVLGQVGLLPSYPGGLPGGETGVKDK